MKPRELLDIMQVAERLKDTTRHCYTAKGRKESVAEHSWMMTVMAYFLRDEFPQVDMDKVIKMCIIHDLGECFTGDVPVFDKTSANEEKEEKLLNNWVESLPQPYRRELKVLYAEMEEKESREAKLYKVIDGLEAVIQHNISPLSTWTDNEYEFNKTYAEDRVQYSEYLKELRAEIKQDTISKIEKGE